MKKYFFLLFFLLSSTTFAFDLIELNQLLSQPSTVRGHFRQERFLRSLPNPIIGEGQFVLRVEDSLLWHLQEPFDEKLKVSKSGVQRWNGQKWIQNTASSGQSKNHITLFMDLLAGRTEALDTHFTLQLSGDKQAWHLRLIPNSLLMKKIFNKIDIEGSNVVQSIVLDEKQGDKMRLLFSDIQTEKTRHAPIH